MHFVLILIIDVLISKESTGITIYNKYYTPEKPPLNWETGLREAAYQTLLRENFAYSGLKNDLIKAPLLGLQNEATPFGDVALLARGQLYTTSDGFEFVQDPYKNDCDDCHNQRSRCFYDNCNERPLSNRKQLIALWTAKRIRHRNPNEGYFYELQYTVSPTVHSTYSNFITRNGHFNYNIPGHVFTVKSNQDSVQSQGNNNFNRNKNLHDERNWRPTNNQQNELFHTDKLKPHSQPEEKRKSNIVVGYKFVSQNINGFYPANDNYVADKAITFYRTATTVKENNSFKRPFDTSNFHLNSTTPTPLTTKQFTELTKTLPKIVSKLPTVQSSISPKYPPEDKNNNLFTDKTSIFRNPTTPIANTANIPPPFPTYLPNRIETVPSIPTNTENNVNYHKTTMKQFPTYAPISKETVPSIQTTTENNVNYHKTTMKQFPTYVPISKETVSSIQTNNVQYHKILMEPLPTGASNSNETVPSFQTTTENNVNYHKITMKQFPKVSVPSIEATGNNVKYNQNAIKPFPPYASNHITSTENNVKYHKITMKTTQEISKNLEEILTTVPTTETFTVNFLNKNISTQPINISFLTSSTTPKSTASSIEHMETKSTVNIKKMKNKSDEVMATTQDNFWSDYDNNMVTEKYDNSVEDQEIDIFEIYEENKMKQDITTTTEITPLTQIIFGNFFLPSPATEDVTTHYQTTEFNSIETTTLPIVEDQEQLEITAATSDTVNVSTVQVTSTPATTVNVSVNHIAANLSRVLDEQNSTEKPAENVNEISTTTERHKNTLTTSSSNVNDSTKIFDNLALSIIGHVKGIEYLTPTTKKKKYKRVVFKRRIIKEIVDKFN